MSTKTSATPSWSLGSSTCTSGGGGAFTDCDQESAIRAIQAHQLHGTTTTIASLVTDSPNGLLNSVKQLAELYDNGHIAGIHLEGPWISPTDAVPTILRIYATPTPVNLTCPSMKHAEPLPWLPWHPNYPAYYGPDPGRWTLG